MKTIFLFFLFLFVMNLVNAQQVEIAVSKNVKSTIYKGDYIKKFDKGTQRQIELENEFITKFRTQVSKNYFEIVSLLGGNSNVRYVREFNRFTTNFILYIHLSIQTQELPLNESNEDVLMEDGSYVHGIYYIKVIFELVDPHTNKIVTMDPMHQAKYKSNNHLSAEYVFQEYWPLFMNVALPRANADKMQKLIEPNIGYRNATIDYKPNEKDKKPKADGKQKGKITVHNIIGDVIGEARNNSITKFKLICEKGTFLETDSKEIEFTGADYYYDDYGGMNRFEADYQTYQCSEYEDEEKNRDNFRLIQIQRSAQQVDFEIKVIDIDFNCEELYDIFVSYHAPKFAKVDLLWENATIRFPEEGEKIQFFDVMAHMNSGADPDAHPTGTDGKPLEIPYEMVVPGIGKQTLYGWTENEFATPIVKSITVLADRKAFVEFKVSLVEDALNSCNISQIGDGPVYMELNFDLFGRVDAGGTLWLQLEVGTREDAVQKMKGGSSVNNYPLSFDLIKFTDDEIEKFKNYEEFERTISNGRATLKVEFKIAAN